ncbi:MAG: hypothetical protein RR555_00730 [Bacteroidales bacterium]
MIKEWCRLLWNLFLPRSCAVCGRELLIHEQHLCLECYAGLPLTYFWNVKENPAEVVFWGRTQVERVYSLYFYVNDYRKPIHSLKYKANIGIGIYLGQMLGKKIATNYNFAKHGKSESNKVSFCNSTPIDFIVPVPLHFRKKWKRGYNQSEIIAKGILKGIAAEYSIPQIIPNLLKRSHFTRTQTQKDRIHRWHNVADAFEINLRWLRKIQTEKIQTEHGSHTPHILLIDDVLTTGATLEACCNILHKHINCKISIATLAYVE